MSPTASSKYLLITGALGNRCDYVVVRNQVHSEHFSLYDKSRIRTRLLGELRAHEITMPKLYDWLVTALNQLNLTVTAAIAPGEFTLIDRQRLLNWQRTLVAQIELAGPFLLREQQERWTPNIGHLPFRKPFWNGKSDAVSPIMTHFWEWWSYSSCSLVLSKRTEPYYRRRRSRSFGIPWNY